MLLTHEQKRDVGRQQQQRGRHPQGSGRHQRRETLAACPVPGLVVVLEADDEAIGRDVHGRTSVPAAAVRRVAPIVHVALTDRLGDRFGSAEIGIVAAPLTGERHVDRVMKVVGPVGVEPEAADRTVPHPSGIVRVDLRDHQRATSQRLALPVHRLADLLGQVHRTQVYDAIGRVEAETIEMVFRHPVHRVVHQVAPHFVAVGTIEVEPVAPRRLVAVREVGTESRQVVPLRAEVVVDHVEQNRESGAVRGIHQPLEPVRAAVRALHRVERHAVVPPVAAAGELGHRHDLHRRHAELAERGKALDDPVERARGSEGPHVQLVDDEIGRLDSTPRAVAPLERGGVHDARRAVHARRPPPAHRVRKLGAAIDAVVVVGAGWRTPNGAVMHPVGVPLQGMRLGASIALHHDLDRLGRRCPDRESGAPVGLREGAALQRSHRERGAQVWDDGSYASTTAPSGGSPMRKDAG